MHEATQRRLVRTTFVLTCLVPTLGIVGWAIAWRLDIHAHRLQQQLGQQLGVLVQTSQLNHPRPNLVQIGRVELLDPETNERIASLHHVELSTTSDQRVITVDQAAVDGSQLARIGQLMRMRLSQQNPSRGRLRKLSCRRVKIVDNADSVLLHDLTSTDRSLEATVRTSLSFAMVDQTDAPRVEIAIVRDRALSVPATQIDLDTGKTSIPVGILSRSVKQRLGPKTTFRGTCRIEYRDDQWHRSVVAGSLDQVDSQRWIIEPIPYRLSGQGTVELQLLELSRQGIEQATGRLKIEEGTIDVDLLRSLADPQYGLITLDPTIKLNSGQPFAFRDLAINVQMDSSGLRIGAPRADVTLDPSPHPIAKSADGREVFVPNHPLPLDHLVLAIVPQELKETCGADFLRILPRPPPRRFLIRR